jgi:lipopolysaccharide transport system ATP-binding protein
MSIPVIKVENLSKQFIIGHEAPERYLSLRDIIAKKAQQLTGNRKKSNVLKEEFYALKDISFEVSAGDRIGIIGRNGAGKSTLLKILSRITEPTTGRIHIRGRVASLLEVGTGFHPELTGRENIFLNGAILGMSRAEIKTKFDEIVDFAEIEKFLDTPVKRYSSGMYVRLAFAVAAHLEPEILVVDEVLAVGDAQFQKKCLGKMEDVSRNEGRTVLFVSHNMGVIAQLCNAGILLNKGVIEKIGAINSVIDKYISHNGGGDNSTYEFDLMENKNKKNYFNKVFNMNIHQLQISEFAFDEPISIVFDFTVKEKVPNLILSIALKDKMQHTIFTVLKPVDFFQNYETNKYRGKLQLPAGLFSPEQYSFALAIWVKDLVVYDFVENVCSIRIYDNGTEYAAYEGMNYGNIIINPKWFND